MLCNLLNKTILNRLLVITLLMPFCVVIHCRGQAMRFTVITSQDGLLSNTVNAITKDHYGFIWFATAHGLDRFDGMAHKAYQVEPENKSGYRSTEVTNMYEDAAGRLWVATMGAGLQYLDREQDKFLPYTETAPYKYLANGYIKSIYGDAKGRLWIAMMGGVCVLDPKTKSETFYGFDQHKPGRFRTPVIQSVFVDGRQRTLVGTDNGLYIYDKALNGFINLRYNDGDTQNNSINVIAECQHNIWIGTNNGLSCIAPDLKTAKNFKYSPDDDNTISGNLVYSIAADGNEIWVGTEGGLNVLDPVTGKMKRYNHDERDNYSVSSKSIRCIYNDGAGVYWLGTYQGGVDKYDRNLTLFNSKQNNAYDVAGLSAPVVSSFAETREGDIYVGTDGGGLNLFHPQTGLFSHIALKSKTKTNSAGLPVLSMMLDRNQQLWIGTFQAGLFIYNTKTGAYQQLNAGTDDTHINHDQVFCFKEANDGKIWIGTNGGGVNVYDPQSKTFLKYVPKRASATEKPIHNNGFIRAIEQDNDGNIWIGTYGNGIAILDHKTQKFTVYNNLNTGLLIDRTFSLLKDHHGDMWIGAAQNGVFRFDLKLKKWTNYPTPSDLQDGVVHKLLEDDSGNIWLSTDKGICMLNPQSKKFTRYSAYNGLQNDAFIDGSGIRTTKGVLFFGGSKGFNYINPQQQVKRNLNTPPVFLTGLKVNNSAVTPGGHSPLQQDISVAKQIDLNYHENFSISYSAVNFTLPQQNRYAYILKSFNKSWNYVGPATTAYYTNLDPGDYTFAVKACNNDGVWNNTGAQIHIVIHPPFWMTWYAYLSYVLFALGALLFIRSRGIKKLKAKLAAEELKREAERLHELDTLKIKFLTNLSHEFRTPISLIMAPTDKLLEEHKDERTKSQLAAIRRNARRLLNMVNQLLDFRKLEEQELRLNIAEGEIISFTKDVADSFCDISESRGITFKLNAPGEKIFVRFDHDKVERILFNLLSNAFKFTMPGGSITVSITQAQVAQPGQTTLEFKVTDTGIGIKPGKQQMIFDRFYQANDAGTGKINSGSGIGLSLTKEFVEMHGGTVTVESEPGNGSAFSVMIPMEVVANQSVESELALIPDVTRHDTPVGKSAAQAATDMPVLLIVEDNDEFRYYMRENLCNQYKVFEACNGAEGWDKALSCHPDLIISDITMPFMNGITLSKKIKADKRTSHIPLIMLTACIGEEEELKALESGANDYLTKPFNFEILNIKIKNLLQLNLSFKNTYKKQLTVIHPDIEVKSSGEIFLAKVVSYIDNNLNNPKFSVVDLSDHLAMSRGALYTKIFSLTGLPPVEFIRSYKLDRAAILLLKSDLTITQIAYEAGFATPHYFSRSFKEKFNMLPSDYRKIGNHDIVA